MMGTLLVSLPSTETTNTALPQHEGIVMKETRCALVAGQQNLAVSLW